jgi:hypothetical protein
VDELATRVADRDAPIATRIDALTAIVGAVAIGRGDLAGALADAVVDALDDLGLVDALVARGRADVAVAALHQLGVRADVDSTRRRLVRRLLAAGVSGLPLAGLAIAIGDHAAGVALAVRDYRAHVAVRVARLPPDPIAAAFAHWLADQPEPVRRAIAAAIDLRELAAHR